MGILLQIYELRWLLALAAGVLYVGQKIQVYYRLKAFKGPFSTGFSELWHSRVLLSTTWHLKYKEVCAKYGTSCRDRLRWTLTSQDLLPELAPTT
jgi:hypothetical protein